MSMSLRDQLLAAGLVSQKQVREAERQQQHQERAQQQSKQKRPPPSQQKQPVPPSGHTASVNTAPGNAAASVASPSAHNGPTHNGQAHSGAIAGASVRNASAQSAKVARDLALNKKHQEKAQQKARAAQIKQLIEQNRVPRGEGDERYNFVDAGRVRFVAANAEIRRRLTAGELFIVRHEGLYEVVPAAIAQKIRERDQGSLINAAATSAETPPLEDAYKDFAVPDDLMW